MLYATHSSSRPPANTRPVTFSSCVAITREGDQEDQRHADAEHQHLLAVARRQAGRQRAHDDDIVAGHGQVADDDLAELGEPARR